VNLIGEHTDYNDGFVMPVALGFSTWAKALPLENRTLQLYSENYDDEVEVNLDDQITPRGDWSDYPVGVAVMLERAGYR
jgi:galactokinase